jgi:hypothetical protein
MSATPNNNQEPRLTRLEQAVKEIEDNLIVMGHLETKQSNLIREQAEYLAGHEQRIQRTERGIEMLTETTNRLGLRIEALVSAIGEYIRSDREKRGL